MKNSFDLDRLSTSGMPVLIGIMAVLFAITQCFTIIEPGYRGVSVVLGKPDTHFRGEGPTFKWPFIERIFKIPVKQITVEGVASSYSSDLQTVEVHFKALYRLPESRVVELYSQIQGDPYRALVEPRIQDAIKQVTAMYRAEDVVKNREQVKLKAKEIVRKTLLLPLGTDHTTMTEEEIAAAVANASEPWVYLEDLPIDNIDLTAELERAIELKQIKEQEALAKEYELKKAKKQVEIAVEEGRAIRAKGAALKATPELIELEIAQKWDGKTPSTVVVGQGRGNVLLPLR